MAPDPDPKISLQCIIVTFALIGCCELPFYYASK